MTIEPTSEYNVAYYDQIDISDIEAIEDEMCAAFAANISGSTTPVDDGDLPPF